MMPQTKYAKSGDVHIAYQVLGDGAIDIVLVHGWVSNIEENWEEPAMARFLRRLASFSRLVVFDKRGTGLSDRVDEKALPTLEQRMDDVRAVMDAVGLEKAAIFGTSEGGPLSMLFAATYPQRTSALVVFGGYAKWLWSPDNSWAPTREAHQHALDAYEQHWGTPIGLRTLAPSTAKDERFRNAFAQYMRRSASPTAAIALYRMNIEIDIRPILSTIRVPTLILHRSADKLINIEAGRYLAEQIPGAKFVELPGEDHLMWVGDADSVLDEVEDFLTGMRHTTDIDRVLGTVLFTDIVGSTEKAADLGTQRWSDLLESRRAVLRRELERFRGQEIKSTGDGLLATFDGPARAIRCACAMVAAVRSLGIEIRAGLHTGEYGLAKNDIDGIAVHIGARVMAQAGPSEVWVSSTVKDLVAGSGIEFEECGVFSLKGVPGEWRLYRAKCGA